MTDWKEKWKEKWKPKANLNKLNQALLRDNRLEDLIRSTTDLEFQEKLLREYHISA